MEGLFNVTLVLVMVCVRTTSKQEKKLTEFKTCENNGYLLATQKGGTA